ncbi:MAG: PASTA domain-containing protein [Leptospiraceae bacterium]|nr:PASTA domain-containing protein [Leptospiraceae bacterium]
MSEESKKEKFGILPITGQVLFLITGLVIFFFAAFFVVLIRTKGNSKIVMPDLVGQNYTDVHNELARLRLKVRLETKRYSEKNDGEILYQSISPGKKLEAGSKLYLTINTGVDKIIMPDLKNQQLNSAKAILDKVLSGESYVSMTLGGVTYLPLEEGQTPDTVVDQIPEAGKNTTTKEKVYLLVTESKPGESKSSLNFENQPFPLVAMSLSKRKIPFRLTQVLPTKDRRENGLIEKSEKQDNGYTLTARYYTSEPKFKSGYEKLEYSLKSSGTYSLRMFEEDKNDKAGTEIMFPNEFKQEEKLNYILYRKGDVVVSLFDATGNKTKSFDFEADIKR